MANSTTLDNLYTLSEILDRIPNVGRNRLLYILGSRGVRAAMTRSGVNFYSEDAVRTIERAVAEIASRRRCRSVPQT